MRISFIVAACAASGVLLPASVRAEEASVCADAQTTVEIGECVRKAYDRADAELNAVWKQAMATVARADYMAPKDRKAWKETLLASQRAWVQFKEKDCEAVGYDWWGGSGASNAVVFCWLDHTTARTKDLKERYLDR